MVYVNWIPDKYSVNIGEIDEQHQKLVAIINEVYEAKMNNSNKKMIYEILIKLDEYTKYHFSAEENLMREYGFKGLDKHKTFHQFFIEKINLFMKDFNQNQEFISDDILTFLRDWLLLHIMDTDKIYAGYLNEKGIF